MRSFASRFQLRFNENKEENLILTKNIKNKMTKLKTINFEDSFIRKKNHFDLNFRQIINTQFLRCFCN